MIFGISLSSLCPLYGRSIHAATAAFSTVFFVSATSAATAASARSKPVSVASGHPRIAAFTRKIQLISVYLLSAGSFPRYSFLGDSYHQETSLQLGGANQLY